MDELKTLLAETSKAPENTRAAVRRLTPEIHIASEQIKRNRQERLQVLAFALCAFLLVALMGFSLWEHQTTGKFSDITKNILITLGAGGVLTVAYAPVLCYFAEEGKNNEEA